MQFSRKIGSTKQFESGYVEPALQYRATIGALSTETVLHLYSLLIVG